MRQQASKQPEEETRREAHKETQPDDIQGIITQPDVYVLDQVEVLKPNDIHKYQIEYRVSYAR